MESSKELNKKGFFRRKSFKKNALIEPNQDFIKIKNTESELQKIPFWVYMWVALRSYLLQNGFNYANFQGLGYGNVIYPALKRLYAKNRSQLKQALLDNIEFFNSNPQTVPLITSIHLSLLANGRSDDEVRTIKMSLMGPLSGIGDSLSQFALFPLFSILAIGFAQSGDITGPILFIVGINIVLIIVKLVLGYLGYKLGEAAIAKLSEKMQTIIRVSSMLGVTIISALALTLTKVKFTLDFSQRIDAGSSGAQTSTVSAQEVLDNIVPFLATAVWVTFIYFMVSKFNWNAYRVIVVTLIVGVTAGVFGILGV